MTDDSLAWVRNEHSGETGKLNKKSLFVGKDMQISSLTPTIGQMVYDTTTDRTFMRDTTNLLWNPNVIETAEQTTTPDDGGVFTSSSILRYYAYFTLPATEVLYKITAIELKRDAGSSTDVNVGVDLVDANPPTLTSLPCVALGRGTITGNETLKIPIEHSSFIRASTLCGAWLASVSNVDYRALTGQGAANVSIGHGLGTTNIYWGIAPAAWTTQTFRPYIKVYYKGYK